MITQKGSVLVLVMVLLLVLTFTSVQLLAQSNLQLKMFQHYFKGDVS